MFVVVPLPLSGEIVMLPVVEPPRVRELFLSAWIEPPASRTIPLPFPPEAVVAERDATGVRAATVLSTANFAEVVAIPPINRS